MKDKRDECGCHRDCIMIDHPCARPCSWPACLTGAERDELATFLKEDGLIS